MVLSPAKWFCLQQDSGQPGHSNLPQSSTQHPGAFNFTLLLCTDCLSYSLVLKPHCRPGVMTSEGDTNLLLYGHNPRSPAPGSWHSAELLPHRPCQASPSQSTTLNGFQPLIKLSASLRMMKCPAVLLGRLVFVASHVSQGRDVRRCWLLPP